MEISTTKSDRLLQMYARLVNGEVLHKKELAQQFHITERSVQRDLESLRCFFAEQELFQEILYDKSVGGYRMGSNASVVLSSSEVLAICKILLESRSMRKDEMLPILDKLVDCYTPKNNKQAVTDLIANEKFHYIEPPHGQPVLSELWDLGMAIREHHFVEITYKRLKEPKWVQRIVEPVGIIFSDHYFYLTACLQNSDKRTALDNGNDLSPTIYRIDRIESLKVMEKRFHIPYAKRFKEGEFRKRMQFMYGGRLQTVHFKYSGSSLDALLDQLPTAEVIGQDENGWLLRAEVFENGLDTWLKDQNKFCDIIRILT